jgi:hypothetical protein
LPLSSRRITTSLCGAARPAQDADEFAQQAVKTPRAHDDDHDSDQRLPAAGVQEIPHQTDEGFHPNDGASDQDDHGQYQRVSHHGRQNYSQPERDTTKSGQSPTSPIDSLTFVFFSDFRVFFARAPIHSQPGGVAYLSRGTSSASAP